MRLPWEHNLRQTLPMFSLIKERDYKMSFEGFLVKGESWSSKYYSSESWWQFDRSNSWICYARKKNRLWRMDKAIYEFLRSTLERRVISFCLVLFCPYCPYCSFYFVLLRFTSFYFVLVVLFVLLRFTSFYFVLLRSVRFTSFCTILRKCLSRDQAAKMSIQWCFFL